jgi:hypothetical protein
MIRLQVDKVASLNYLGIPTMHLMHKRSIAI